MTEMMTLLPLKLRLMREAAGMTQERLAYKSGVGEKTISTFETGRFIRGAKMYQIERLANACGFTFDQFVAMKPDDFGPPQALQPHHAWHDKTPVVFTRIERTKPMLAAQHVRPRPVTLFRSSDYLGSSLGEPRR